jgi:hypothetical protein
VLWLVSRRSVLSWKPLLLILRTLISVPKHMMYSSNGLYQMHNHIQSIQFTICGVVGFPAPSYTLTCLPHHSSSSGQHPKLCNSCWSAHERITHCWAEYCNVWDIVSILPGQPVMIDFCDPTSSLVILAGLFAVHMSV